MPYPWLIKSARYGVAAALLVGAAFAPAFSADEDARNAIPNFAPDTQGEALVARVHQYAREAGRDPAQLPLEGRIRLAGQDPDGWAKQVGAWQALGATSLIAEPRGGGFSFPDGHLSVLRRFKETVS